MSAAAFATRLDHDSSSSSRRPHTLQPRPLRDQAFELHCLGLRSSAISEQLGVPQRTVRAWLAADLKALAEEQRATRREQLALAVERQHALTASAWREFEAETAARHALLDALMQALADLAVPNRSATSSGNQDSPRLPRLPTTTPAPRYLSLIFQANKEIARLLGLYTLARLDFLTANAPESPDLDLSSIAETDIPAESATANGAPTAPEPYPHPSLAADRSAAPLPAHGEGPAVRFHAPAKTATAPASHGAGPVGASTRTPLPGRHIPAESAAEPNRLAAGIQPTNLKATMLSPSLASASPAAPFSAHGAARAEGSDVAGAERAESEAVGPGMRFPLPAKSATSSRNRPTAKRPANRSRRRRHH